MKKSNNKGFSLVELIIVIAIMVVLIGVLAPMFFRYVEKSKQGSDIDALASAITVAQAYYADKTAPDTVTITVAPNTAISAGSDTKLNTEFTNSGTNTYKGKGKATFTATIDYKDGHGKITYSVSGDTSYYNTNADNTTIEAQ